MKRRTKWTVALAALLAIGLAAPVGLAGPKGYKCTLDTQVCLNKMVQKVKSKGWLGIEYDYIEGEERMWLTKVVPESPAEAAGFKAGDILISVNGVKFADNTEDECVTCKKMGEIWKPGAKVTYIVERDGKKRELSAILAPLPSDMMAVMVGLHMIEHADLEAGSK